MVKLVLDRSVFHGERFQRLKGALGEQSRSSVRVFVSVTLLEETLAFWFHRRAQETKEHLQFLLGVTKERWFEDPYTIFKIELGKLSCRGDYWFMSRKDEGRLREQIESLCRGWEPNQNQLHRALLLSKDRYRRMKVLREVGKKARRFMSAEWKKLVKPGKKLSYVDTKAAWQSFQNKHLIEFGTDLIVKKDFYGCRKVAIRRWERERWRCPFFNEWATGLLYTQFYAMRYQSDPIDKGAQPDTEHLMYLLKADAILSEEKGFMRRAFEDLYAAWGKRYLTIQEMAEIN